MQPHQQRVVDEKSQLDEKLVKLSSFLGTELFRSLDADEQDRLRRQESLMSAYSGVLDERIVAFKKKEETQRLASESASY